MSKGRLEAFSDGVIAIIALALAFVIPWASGALYVLVVLIWLLPDQRIEKTRAT